jgi:hypothetical protein
MVVLSAIVWSGVVSAATINIDSRQGLFTSFAGIQTVAITPHSVWEANRPVNPGDPTDTAAIWISYADTGFGGTQFQPAAAGTPVVTIFDTFQSGAGMLMLYVWADDTASVLLDGNLLMPAVFTQGTCSGQAIGCRPQDVGSISASLSAGQHTLSFVLYQVGTGTNTLSNPFGLLFTGTAPARGPDDNPFPESEVVESGVPEPGTWGLLASSLAGLVWLHRRSRSGRHSL